MCTSRSTGSNSYISASHDYGRSWSKPVRTNKGGRYWFAEGGAVAPDGRVYFAESAEHQNAKGTVRLAVISSADGGASWTTTYVALSQQQPRCPTADCPNDFYGAQIARRRPRRDHPRRLRRERHGQGADEALCDHVGRRRVLERAH
jgi:hypothetical protein